MTKSKHDEQVVRDEADATVRDNARQAAVLIKPPQKSFWKSLWTKLKRSVGSVS